MKYLQFSSVAELLDHIESENASGFESIGTESLRTVHLDLNERHSPSGMGFAVVSIFAIVSQNCGDYLAVYGALLNQIDDIHIRANDERARSERDKFNAQNEERLDKVREQITSRAFLVRRGVWTGEAPTYLRRAS